MMEPTQPQPNQAQTAPWLASEPPKPPKERRRRKWLALPAAFAAGGLLLGAAAGAGIMASLSDPTKSEEYRDLLVLKDDRDERISELTADTRRAESRAETVEDGLAARRAQLDEREEKLVAAEGQIRAREEAVTATEQAVAARSVGPGTWTVGIDIEPGTYRTQEAVLGQCYWAILRSGSNGDIIENDIVSGGFPTVTLSVGQDFEHNRCGTFVKQ